MASWARCSSSGWGASLDIRALGRHPALILLGVALGLGAAAVHVAMRVTGQPVPVALLAAAQLGVPVAAATLGAQAGVLRPGEPAAIVLDALLTMAIAIPAAGRLAAAPDEAAHHMKPLTR
jgi:hypothetical protein